MPDTKEHGFLFKAEMIRAMLAGFKTQTRRVVTAHNSLLDGTGEGIRAHWKHLEWDKAWVDPGPSPVGNPGPYWKVPCNRPDYCEGVVHRVYPRVQEGDLIYARETWAPVSDHTGDDPGSWAQALGYFYAADYPSHAAGRLECSIQKWHSPLHMRRRAARIVVPVTGVRAARVGDIDCNDAAAEGTPDLRTLENNWDMRDCFIALWDSINGARAGMSFADNPVLWIYEWEPMQ